MRDSPKFFLLYIMIHVKFNQYKMPVIESKCLRWLLIFHTTVINFLFTYFGSIGTRGLMSSVLLNYIASPGSILLSDGEHLSAFLARF